MALFSIIDGSNAIIRNAKSGVYKQVKVYERANELYVAANGGFIRLLRDNRTSNPNMKWEYVDVGYEQVVGASTSLFRKPESAKLRAA